MSTVNTSFVTIVVLVCVYSSSSAAIDGNGKALADALTRKPYTVHMIKAMKPQPFSVHEHWYASLVREVSGFQFDPAQFLYSYNHAIHGFAASLTSAEARALESMDSCLAVIRSSVYTRHTTHSPKFMGLHGKSEGGGLWPLSNYGRDVIVGVIDSGIWPESRSFRDAGLGPVPARWKGQCERGVMFDSSHCNRKIVGARYFAKGYEAEYGKINISIDYRSPRGIDGHGTHCASTAAGSAVAQSSFVGFSNGTAIGMAPRARVAIYKVLWGPKGKGSGVDVYAAVEKAIEDNVDILSMSVGGSEFEVDSIATLGALEAGVFVSMAAGNEGPSGSTASNTAPWVTTVGASSVDREFPAPVTLGNLETYKGTSFYRGPGVENLPLVYASHNLSSMYCLSGSLHSTMVKDKVVLCDLDSPVEQGTEVKRAGGAGIIFVIPEAYGGDDYLSVYLKDFKGLPATMVSFWTGRKIKAYINSTGTPTATIKTTGSTVVGRATRAPIVAAFSSRGPSRVFPDVLKPDVIAPGVLILAAWTKGGYEIMSGTSMACPHVSGIAALIKATHPSWSPSAIRSALMTSSYVRDNKRQLIKDVVDLRPATPFAMGAGHVDPTAAVDPGLVYDMGFQDYADFICNIKSSNKIISVLVQLLSCPKSKPTDMEAGDLNYPSYSVVFSPERALSLQRRRVTNVGGGSGVYRVAVKSPPHVRISVEPRTLRFKGQNERLSYVVRFESLVNASEHNGRHEFGRIVWKCTEGGQYAVQSPVAVAWTHPKSK